MVCIRRNGELVWITEVDHWEEDDFGFCGYISCVENHDALHYKLPDCKDFPNQYQYDSIILELSGIAEWGLKNDQIQVRQDYTGYIVMFCCNHDGWDTVYFYTLDDSRPLVKHCLDTLYDKVSLHMMHGKYCIYDWSDQGIPLECVSNSLFKEAEVQETDFKYKIRLVS